MKFKEVKQSNLGHNIGKSNHSNLFNLVWHVKVLQTISWTTLNSLNASATFLKPPCYINKTDVVRFCCKFFWGGGYCCKWFLDFLFSLRIQWKLDFANVIHCSRVRLWVGYFIYLKFKLVFFHLMYLMDVL